MKVVKGDQLPWESGLEVLASAQQLVNSEKFYIWIKALGLVWKPQ